MRAYDRTYLSDVVENQGKLFDFISLDFPDKDTEDFINTYMKSKVRKSIDEGQPYVNSMSAKDLWEYFSKTEHYALKEGKALGGFFPMWLGEFYAYYQWYYNITSKELIEKLPVETMKLPYLGLCDLALELAVEKVGTV